MGAACEEEQAENEVGALGRPAASPSRGCAPCPGVCGGASAASASCSIYGAALRSEAVLDRCVEGEPRTPAGAPAGDLHGLEPVAD